MRHIHKFNDQWKFTRGDIDAGQSVELNDSEWRSVTLPHDWSIEGPFEPHWASATGYLPGGIGWYRKCFDLPEEYHSQHVFLHFDGVYCNSDVWLNGHHLGRRPNGHIGFRYELTPYLRRDDTNVLAVKVDHQNYGDARWYTGSGINRNVFLIGVEPVHIKQWGVSVTTPLVTPEQAEVQTETTIENQSQVSSEMRVEQILMDGSGATVARASDSLIVAAAQEKTLGLTLQIAQPRLWSVDQPDLYRLRTQVSVQGDVVDTVETPFGIRTIRFDPDAGFFLNGQNLKLKGVCLHDDAGALGTAVPIKVWERRLGLLKQAGVNAIRMAHNPHMPELYDLCDRMGFLVQDEAFDEWEGGKNKWIAGWNVSEPGKDGYHTSFQDWAETDLRDLILGHQNHPSIVMWSIGNEIDYPNDPYSHEVLENGTTPQMHGRGFQPDSPHADRLGQVARQLAEVVKSVDQTRPVTAGLAAALISNETGFADALDLAGYNYQEYRYPEDHAKYPARVIYGSENGMRGSAWNGVLDNAYICGQFLWTGIDYLGEARQWPSRSSGSGLLDLAGLPKPEYYFRQSLWTSQPMVALGTRPVPQGDEPGSLWRHNMGERLWAGNEDNLIRVTCATNCAQAELIVNDKSVGIKNSEDAQDFLLWWDVPYEAGIVTVRGIIDGKTAATDSLQTSGPAARIAASTDTTELLVDGTDLAHVIVIVTDVEGVPVYTATDEITWTITGPATLLGLESGDHASHENYQADRRRIHHGRLLGYVQATEPLGEISIALSAPGLEGVVVRLRSA